jgi:hypothetical protein
MSLGAHLISQIKLHYYLSYSCPPLPTHPANPLRPDLAVETRTTSRLPSYPVRPALELPEDHAQKETFYCQTSAREGRIPELDGSNVPSERPTAAWCRMSTQSLFSGEPSFAARFGRQL